MKTTMKILSLVSFLSLGFAGVAHAGEGAARRGQVNVQAAAAKAVVAGPAVVKMYSGFSGAQVFVAAAVVGHGRRLRGRRSYRGHEVAGGSRRDRHRGGGSGRLRREHGRAQDRAAVARAAGHVGDRAHRAALTAPSP